jgi:iron complex transport system ATP-binding protein
MANPLLSVSDLDVRRGGRLVVEGLGFTVDAGTALVLLGPNGAGKSTVLKAILGLIPYQGTVQLDGRDARELPPRQRARQVAYVPQHSALDAPLPVRDVVAQGRFPHGDGDLPFARPRRDDVLKVAAAMDRTDISALADRPFDALSYGERRRVLLARALCTEAPVLLLDEPTAALDVGHALALLKVLREVARAGTAVVLVLHQLQEAAAFADRAVLLAAGRSVRQGPAAEVIAPEPVRAVYGVDMLPHAQFACRLPGEDDTDDLDRGSRP